MQKLTLGVIGAASLFALPALAQTTGSTQSGAGNSASTSSTSPVNVQQLEQKITQDLRSDGYTNIRVVPDSFLVNATDKRGNPVVMIINPHSVFAISEVGAGAANRGGAHGGGSGTGSNPGANPSTTK